MQKDEVDLRAESKKNLESLQKVPKNFNKLRVLNTRPINDAKELSEQINLAGGLAFELPIISIYPSNLDWLEKISDLNKIKQIIFISKNAVRYFFAGLATAKLELPKDTLITCIGPGTAELLTKYKNKANYVPDINNSEHLLQLENFTNVLNQNILLVKGIGGRNVIQEGLKTRGANLTVVDVYVRKSPEISPKIIDKIWQEDSIDIIIYTSKQAMLNIIEIFPESAKTWLLSKPSIVISERLVEHAKKLGFKNIIQTNYANIVTTIKGQIK